MKSFILLLVSINNKFLIYFVHYIQQKKNNIVWTFFKQLKNIACEPKVTTRFETTNYLILKE
jgi:hypothetical protein